MAREPAGRPGRRGDRPGPRAAVIAGAAVTIALVLHLWRPTGPVGDGSYLLVTTGSALVALVLLAAMAREDRRAWVLVVAGVTASAIGDLVEQSYRVGGSEAPDVSWADPWWLGAYVFLALGAMRVFRPRSSLVVVDVDSLIESAAIGAVVAFGLWQLFLSPVLQDDTLSASAQLVTAAYPALDAALLLLVVRNLGRRRRLRRRADRRADQASTAWVNRGASRGQHNRAATNGDPSARVLMDPATLLGAGVACWLASDVAYLVAAEVDLGRYERFMNAGWMLGASLLAAAVWLRTSPAPRPVEVDASPTIAPGQVAWTVAPVFVPSLVTVVAKLQGHDIEPVALLVLTVVLAALVVVRVVRLALAHNRALERLAGREQFFRVLAGASSDAVFVVDGDRRILHDNPKLHDLLGRPHRDVVGLDAADVVAASEEGAIQDLVTKAILAPDRIHQCDLGTAGDPTSSRAFQGRAVNHLDDPEVGGIVITLHDVTERVASAEALRRQAFHDPLTGLANRALFRDRLEHALERSRRAGSSPAVLYLDVDGFKRVNDSLGHEAGDTLLVALGRRIQDAVREEDTVARLGGDEFAVLVEDGADPASQAVVAAERIATALAEPVAIGLRTTSLSASIGIEVGGPDLDAGMVLRNADIAMYRAKATGRGRWVRFDATMRDHAVERLDLEIDLANALRRGQLAVRYQPVVDLATGGVVGFEALVRWEHPERGELAPPVFMRLAEESGLIVEIGAWVLHEACAAAVTWQQAHPDHAGLTMAVNISGVQLARQVFAGEVAEVLAGTGLAPTQLTLEMTETVLVADPVEAARRLAELRVLGVRVAIDDFGTGYSSLSYLRQFPVDILKIDQSFVADIDLGLPLALPPLTRALLDLGRTLDLVVVAEGIEQADQWQRLRDGTCQLGQGYHFARPLSPDEVTALLTEGPPWTLPVRPGGPGDGPHRQESAVPSP